MKHLGFLLLIGWTWCQLFLVFLVSRYHATALGRLFHHFLSSSLIHHYCFDHSNSTHISWEIYWLLHIQRSFHTFMARKRNIHFLMQLGSFTAEPLNLISSTWNQQIWNMLRYPWMPILRYVMHHSLSKMQDNNLDACSSLNRLSQSFPALQVITSFSICLLAYSLFLSVPGDFQNGL